MMNDLESVTAFAPATSANLAVGFDILGFPIDGLGDEVTLTIRDDNKIIINEIISQDQLPKETDKNTATVAIKAMQEHLNLEQGFDVSINKGIPLGSGLGGSAASSVAAVVAFNQFLQQPLSLKALVPFALEGERAATGAIHGDNVIPCLYGGLTLIHSLDPLQVITLPSIDITTVLIHPHIQINTRDARAALKSEVPLHDFIQQNAHTAAFISAVYQNDLALLAKSCKDLIIEPMRSHLIPNFQAVQQAALDNQALACSISGAGPTLFAFAASQKQAIVIGQAMSDVFTDDGIACDIHVSPIAQQGARVIA